MNVLIYRKRRFNRPLSVEPRAFSSLSLFSTSPLARFFDTIVLSMKLELITMLGIKAEHDVYELLIPTADGEIGIFPGHEPLVTIAAPGAISVRYKKGDPDSKLDFFAISGGVVEIDQQRVRILVDEAESGEDIIEAESKAALDRAIAARDSARNDIELEKAHQLVDRHTVRLKVADLHRRHHR